MKKTVGMMGVLALAATTALAQSTPTTAPEGQSGTSTTGQSAAGAPGQSSQDLDQDKDQKDKDHAHGMTPADQTSTAASATGAAELSSSDRRFIEKAARHGMAEVELGRLATEKASSPEVKAFGQMMVDEHTKANEELKTLASQKGVTLPTDTEASFQSTKDKLGKLEGEEFDKAFMKQMVKDHKQAVKDFQKQSKADKGDSDVNQWASKALPTLEQHLQQAQQAADTAGGTAATGTISPTPDDDKDKDQKDKDKDRADPPPPDRNR